MYKFQAREALKRGEQDHTTAAEVSVMLYFTPAFRMAVSDPIYHIRRQVAFANLVLSKSEIPVKLYIYCIEELLGFVESSDGLERIYDFQDAKKNLLNTADMAILMTGTPTDKSVGLAWLGPPIKYGTLPIAWVYPEDPLTFLHELGHIFGCLHNREEQEQGPNSIGNNLA